MNEIKNDMWEEDKVLFRTMSENYISDNERFFFVTLQRKQESELTYSNELLIDDHDNPDGLYMVRVNFEEYEIGRIIDDHRIGEEFHAMYLAEALDLKLGCFNMAPSQMTLFDWLRANDYQYVKYNRNYDNL